MPRRSTAEAGLSLDGARVLEEADEAARVIIREFAVLGMSR